MLTRIQLEKNWHHFWVVYYKLLLEGCMDESHRFRISIKINQHKNKLADLTLSQAS